MTKESILQGSCHCGAVRFEVKVDLTSPANRCNCSICTKLGVTSAIVKPADLRVLSEPSATTTYVWGGKISTRHFCPACGVHCFAYGHLAELGGDYASVNLNALDGVEVTQIPVTYWDGRHDNWDAGPRAEPYPIRAA